MITTEVQMKFNRGKKTVVRNKWFYNLEHLDDHLQKRTESKRREILS